MPEGNCRLCNRFADLQLSHVIPAFAFRWLRATSGTGHLRTGIEPNRRVQDGQKFYWLCQSCETVLSSYETAFTKNLYHPYSRGDQVRFRYGRWLMLFCTSVSWRVLRFFREEAPHTDYSEDLLNRIENADHAWRRVLLGHCPHPGSYQQHILPLDAITQATGDFPPNFNRYIMRAIDMDLVHSESTAFVYSKLGRFIILGFIREDRPLNWRGSKVHATEGLLEPRKFVLPRQFGDYLIEKSRKMADLAASVSDRQREKINQAFWKNIDKVAESDALKAMDSDVQLFGEAAFSGRQAPTKDEN